jgi:SulP family sulfate permease
MQSYPANGSDSRSFVVAGSGGRTQVANVTAAGLVAVTLIVLTPVFRYLPQAPLGAVVLVAAVRMIDIAALRRLWKARRSGAENIHLTVRAAARASVGHETIPGG